MSMWHNHGSFEMMAKSRRSAQYRQSPPRWCNTCRPDDNSSQSSSVPPPPPYPPPIKTTTTKPRRSVSPSKNRFPSPSKKKQQAATTFAAAVSPRTSSSSSKKVKKKRPNLMSASAPLLGAVPLPTAGAKRTSFGSSIRAYAGASSRKKLLPSISDGSAPNKSSKRRKSISRTIQAPLKNVSRGLAMVSSKVKAKRGKNKSARQPKEQESDLPSSPYKRFGSDDSPGSSETEVCTSLHKENVWNDNSTHSERGIFHVDSSGSGFDDTKVGCTNHFRDSGRPKSPLDKILDKTVGLCCGEYPQFDQDALNQVNAAYCTNPKEMQQDFSLHGALSPTNSLMDNIEEDDDLDLLTLEEEDERSEFEALLLQQALQEEEPSPMSAGFLAMIEASPPSMPALEEEDQEDDVWSDSGLSIPSLSENPEEVCESPGDVVIVPHDATNADKAADSALAWGALSMLLGSPAPQSVQVKKQKKRSTPVNLWQDDGDESMPAMPPIEDLDDISLLDDGSVTQASQSQASQTQASQSQALSQEDENRIKFNEALERAMSQRKINKGSTPKAFYTSYESKMVELSPQRRSQQDIQEDDCCSLPSINPESLESGVLMVVPALQEPPNKDDAADSALAWSALSMFLGSPAPQSVVKRKPRRSRVPVNLWLDVEATSEDLDDIISLPQDDCDVSELMGELQALNLDAKEGHVDELDDCSIPSVMLELQIDEDLIPDIMDDCNDDQAFHTPTARKSSDMDTLAFTALAAILGSPAPSSVVKKSAAKKRGVMNFWADGEDDLLPEIDEQECAVYGDESDNLSVPSIGDDDEIDLNELVAADEDLNANDLVETKQADNGKESAEAVLAWSALGMFLGSPAPKSIVKKKATKTAKNLWSDSEVLDNDALYTIPSIDSDEDEIPSPLSDTPSVAQKWFVGEGQDASSSDDEDTHSIPSLSRMPSLAGTSDGDESEPPSSPLTLGMMSSEDVTAFSFKRESSSKDLADSVLAWSAFAAIMGSPAPRAVLPKRKKESKDLWGDEGDAHGCGTADFDLMSV